ncbi:unnamed protein product [Chondrus crispus]|uniref:Uncharacterized protein n=1 Tax=Chondrus crispus TaxID=2769 RepID=R7Q5B7_CHOCR|nr:unnamed protein product [Chondrus crispus]CDF33023.1 unnamed protein product [Chondrus crispus]|eukprot:XP_005712826.1 unnamed protein product [Chondrus crispus]
MRTTSHSGLQRRQASSPLRSPTPPGFLPPPVSNAARLPPPSGLQRRQVSSPLQALFLPPHHPPLLPRTLILDSSSSLPRSLSVLFFFPNPLHHPPSATATPRPYFVMGRGQVLRKSISAGTARKVRNNYSTAFLAAIAALVLEDDTLNAVAARLQLDRVASSPLRGHRRVNIVRNRTNISFEESNAIYIDKEFDGQCSCSGESLHILP